MVIKPEDFSIDTALHESVDDALPHIEEAQIAVSVDAPSTPVLVYADRTLTRRILQNLLSNAIRHSRAAKIRLIVVPQDNRVLVGVADQGDGIPPDYQKLIFERFRHFDRSPHAQSDTGLGLPFCKLAVEQMGGTIWVDSREGQGTTFYFTLPKAQAVSM